MISVCIATYNGEKYIKNQIKSVLSQLGRDDEIIISDDHSTDSTKDILYAFCDDRIKIFEGPAKGHPRYNFENALTHCTGDYIFLCDQDDLWEPNKVEVFVEHLRNNALVVSDCSVIDGVGNLILDSFQSLKSPNQYGFWNNLAHNHYLGCCMAFRRELLDIVMPFPPRIAQHDIWIGLCAEFYKKKITFIPDRLMKYRRYDGNFSHDSHDYGIAFKLYYRLYFIIQILRRYFRCNNSTFCKR